MSNLDVRWVSGLVGPLRVAPGSKVRLPGDFDPGARFGVRKKKDGARLLTQGVELLTEYQQRLAAQDTYAVLIVLQGMDASGKDGTIRHVMSGVNPQGVHVSSFKVPSAEELGHDYLWRLPGGCRRAGRSGSSTGPTTRKSSPSGCTRRIWTGRSSRPSREATTYGSGGSGKSTTGSVT